MPTPDEARRLDLGPGTPVAHHICTGTTTEDMPVRVELNILPSDRHVIVYERAKPT
jgi:GntR family transcriptional regulator